MLWPHEQHDNRDISMPLTLMSRAKAIELALSVLPLTDEDRIGIEQKKQTSATAYILL